jgi:hypothetical protein
MKKYAKILVAVTFLLGLGVAAKAETRPEIIAKFPFQFMVGGKTLPAGTYKVSRLGDDPLSPLMLTNDDRTGWGALLTQLDSDRGSRLQHLRISFARHGGCRARQCLRFRKCRRPLDCRLLCY